VKQVPNIEEGRVDQQKITEYLLNTEHPDGSSKAEFFLRHGFSESRWNVLATAIKAQAMNNPVVEAKEARYGTQYVVEGTIASPGGRNPNIRTVWIVENNSRVPRLITAYPQTS
jgi:hypothetical protein